MTTGRWTSRRSLRTLAAAAVASLAVGASTLPGGSQTPARPGTTVTAVSGHAVGLAADFVLDTQEPMEMSAALDAMRAGDTAALEGLLAAAGIDVNGDVDAQVIETVTAGPAPEVTLPPEGGGPFTDSLPSLTFGDPVNEQITGPLAVSTEGALGTAGYAASTASIEDLDPEETGDILLAASLVEVECRSDLAAGPVGSTRILDGVDLEGDPAPELPDPNTVLVDVVDELPIGDVVFRLTAQLVVNEQTVGANDITVVGSRSFLLAEVEPEGEDPIFLFEVNSVVGEVQCGVVPGQVVEPTFTG